jgi:hypothetical protein
VEVPGVGGQGSHDVVREAVDIPQLHNLSEKSSGATKPFFRSAAKKMRQVRYLIHMYAWKHFLNTSILLAS